MPTARRAPAALLLRRGGERLLFDCAEGTQRQLQRSSVGLPEIEEIFLTHLHADHVLGPARPGRKIAITGDTAPSPSVIQAAHHADLLVHEATFADEDKERARETMHATAVEAAQVAKLADVRLLALTHVSPRTMP